MIRVLSAVLPRYQKKTAELYYNCYGDGSVSVLQTGAVTVYVIKGASVPTYLQQNYGLQNLGSLQNIRRDISLSVVDVSGVAWKNSYGAPFSSQ